MGSAGHPGGDRCWGIDVFCDSMGIFGSEKRPSYADTKTDDTKPFNPKHLTYEVFGPPGTVADISYFDVHADPQRLARGALAVVVAVRDHPGGGRGKYRRAGRIVPASAAASWWTVKSKPRRSRTKWSAFTFAC